MMLQLDSSAFGTTASSNTSVNTPSQSPSKNPCKVRVRAGNYRNEPYGARVLPPIANAPKLPTNPAPLNDIEPTPRPRPNNRRSQSSFASRIHDNVARAASFSTHATEDSDVSNTLPPMVPTAPTSSNAGSFSAAASSGYHTLPQPPTSGSATSRRSTPPPAATPSPIPEETEADLHTAMPPPPAYNACGVSPLAEMANSVNGLSEESVTSSQDHPFGSSSLVNDDCTTQSSSTAAAPLVDKNAEPIMFAYVRFKYESCCYKSSFHVSVGDRVIVEGDRGHNMGMVERVMPLEQQPKFPVPCSIARFATDEEMRLAGEYRLRELEATHLSSELAVYYRLPIRIIDTEFQFDGQKLTVFFDSSSFVDFRRLQRALFREYNCRIWLVNWKEIRRNL